MKKKFVFPALTTAKFESESILAAISGAQTDTNGITEGEYAIRTETFENMKNWTFVM